MPTRRTKPDPVVYLLHFSRPISEGHTAQHYIGYSDNLTQRLQHHRNGQGGRLPAVAAERGIGFQLSRTWIGGDRTLERRIKNRKEAPKLCPLCNPKAFSVGLYLDALRPDIHAQIQSLKANRKPKATMTPAQEADLETYLDSLPEPESPRPVCGMCRHFVPARQLSCCGDRPVNAPSHCSLRAAADLHSLYSSSDPYAEQCSFYEEEIPF